MVGKKVENLQETYTVSGFISICNEIQGGNDYYCELIAHGESAVSLRLPTIFLDYSRISILPVCAR